MNENDRKILVELLEIQQGFLHMFLQDYLNRKESTLIKSSVEYLWQNYLRFKELAAQLRTASSKDYADASDPRTPGIRTTGRPIEDGESL